MLTFYKNRPEVTRVDTLDWMRGFIFLLMAVDHAMHAYAANWGKYAFFRDYDRSPIFDALYLFNQAAIMPVLFFTFGAYVLPKLAAYGARNFWADRFVKFGLPFLFGIPIITPLLSYPKYKEFEDTGISYMDYWLTVFFPHKLQAGPFWVMYALLLYTAVFLLINRFVPNMIHTLARWIQRAFDRPVKPIMAFVGFSALVYGLSDLRFGAPWWISFRDVFPSYLYGQLFSLQGSKFLMNFVYFVMGAAFMKSRVWEEPALKNLWVDFLEKRYFFLVCTLTFGGLYALFCHVYFFDGAFDYSIYQALRLGGGDLDAWRNALSLLDEKAPPILLRTALMGALAVFQLLTLLAFFGHIRRQTEKREQRKSTVFWSSAAACAWGIFIFHDPIMIWLQFSLVPINIHIALKVLIVTFGGILPAWILSHGLLKIPYIRRIFEKD